MRATGVVRALALCVYAASLELRGGGSFPGPPPIEPTDDNAPTSFPTTDEPTEAPNPLPTTGVPTVFATPAPIITALMTLVVPLSFKFVDSILLNGDDMAKAAYSVTLVDTLALGGSGKGDGQALFDNALNLVEGELERGTFVSNIQKNTVLEAQKVADETGNATPPSKIFDNAAIPANASEISRTNSFFELQVEEIAPTRKPTPEPTLKPTAKPTTEPTTAKPTTEPMAKPTPAPTNDGDASPTVSPTVSPTAAPTTAPSVAPKLTPSLTPSSKPTVSPTAAPTPEPTPKPTTSPSAYSYEQMPRASYSYSYAQMPRASYSYASYSYEQTPRASYSYASYSYEQMPRRSYSYSYAQMPRASYSYASYSYEQISPAPTTNAPTTATVLPTPSPGNAVCEDDAKWFGGQPELICSWVALDTEARCSVVSSDEGVPAFEACRSSCSSCVCSVDGEAGKGEACVDCFTSPDEVKETCFYYVGEGKFLGDCGTRYGAGVTLSSITSAARTLNAARVVLLLLRANAARVVL
ncbi:hypothetical protein M885DRAFT_502921 [Pelagophyceae sp. CCMP2097]|nr:hypothetical protein M885DRAFT_502921 [Pelagophyceae sp. CCMP2097]